MGAIFEKKRWAKVLEFIRLISSFYILFIMMKPAIELLPILLWTSVKKLISNSNDIMIG
jgi:hypothetical protein